jgi:hypothetical protein
MTPANDNTAPITATYLDYGGAVPAKLVARKTRKGVTYRWEDYRGFTCDGLRRGIYSVAYQLRHARSHARFTDVREG